MCGCGGLFATVNGALSACQTFETLLTELLAAAPPAAADWATKMTWARTFYQDIMPHVSADRAARHVLDVYGHSKEDVAACHKQANFLTKIIHSVPEADDVLAQVKAQPKCLTCNNKAHEWLHSKDGDWCTECREKCAVCRFAHAREERGYKETTERLKTGCRRPLEHPDPAASQY